MYTHLMQMCGYAPDEVEKERPRLDRVFQTLGLGPKDIETAEKRLPIQFDMELQGVRKLLHTWWTEFVDLILAREEGKKIVYVTAPAWPGEPQEILNVAAEAAGVKDKVLVTMADFLMSTVMGIVFDKNNDVVKEGEDAGLSASAMHCVINQCMLGSLTKGYVPHPDLEIASGFLCDQIAQAEEWFGEMWGYETVIADSPFDIGWDEWPDISPRKVEYLTSRYRRALDRAAEVLGVRITDDIIKEARKRYIQAYVDGFAPIRDLMPLDPLPVSIRNLAPFYFMSPLSRKDMYVDAAQTLVKEAKQRRKDGLSALPAGAPRVIFPLCPNVDTSLVRIVEEAGLHIPTMIMMNATKRELQIKRKATDPLERIIEGFLTSPWASGNIIPMKEWVVDMARRFDADGVLWFYMAVCRANAATNPIALRKALMEETGLPVLMIEGDYHCTRMYPAEEMRTRIETFAEVVKNRNAARLAQA